MTDSLRVERLANTYLASRGHPAPERLRSELDELARHRVSASCERALAELLDPRDPSVWVIDELNVDFLIDVSAAPPEDLATFWAAQIAQSLLKTFSAGPDGERVIRFANRAEYLARFLRDLASGRAWDQWYYGQFDSLRSLPAAAAIREALFREPEEAEPALVHLYQTEELKLVAGRLTRFDHRLLLQLCSPEEAPPTSECFAAVIRAWIESGAGSGASDLELYAQMRSNHPEHAPAEVRSSIAHLNAIARWIRLSHFNTIMAALRNGLVQDAMRHLSPREQESLLFLYSLSAADPTWIENLSALGEAGPPPMVAEGLSSGRADGITRFRSSFGGLFLVLPVLIENRELVRLYGDAEDKFLRYFLLLACCGPHSASAERDPALLLASGLDEAPKNAELLQARLRHKSDDCDRETGEEGIEFFQAHIAGFCADAGMRTELAWAAALLMRGLARRLPGLSKSSADFLWRNVLAGDAWFTVSPGLILVELSARPLEIVMRMAGLHDLTFSPPWLPDGEVRIRFENQ